MIKKYRPKHCPAPKAFNLPNRTYHGTINMSSIVGDVRNLFRKAPSVVAQFVDHTEPRPRSPDWSPQLIYQMFDSSWILQTIARVKIHEMKRPGWQIYPRFRTKCESCLSEFQTDVTECPRCKSLTRTPDWNQLAVANMILKTPNSSRQSFGDILGSITYHDIVMDMWYISAAYAPVYIKDQATEKFVKTDDYIPKEIYVEDSKFIQVMADDRGRIRSNEWFCPICFPESDPEGAYPKPGACKMCGRPLVMTAYVQKIGNEVKNRFGLDQMAHGSTFKVLPNYFGAPRAISVWDILKTLKAMDEWFFDTYRSGKLGKIINFPQYDPDQVKAMAIKLRETEAAMDEIDNITGEARTRKGARNLMIGSAEPIGVHDVINSPKDMMMLEYYLLGIRAVCGVFGVQPIMISLQEEKGGQMPYLKIEVNNRDIEELQRDKEESINEQLFPIFSVIDFVIKFGDLEKKDELRDAQIAKLRAETVKLYVDSGFKVFVDKEGRVRLGEGAATPEEGGGNERIPGPSVRGEQESEASGRLINETTVERQNQGRNTGVV